MEREEPAPRRHSYTKALVAARAAPGVALGARTDAPGLGGHPGWRRRGADRHYPAASGANASGRRGATPFSFLTLPPVSRLIYKRQEEAAGSAPGPDRLRRWEIPPGGGFAVTWWEQGARRSGSPGRPRCGFGQDTAWHGTAGHSAIVPEAGGVCLPPNTCWQRRSYFLSWQRAPLVTWTCRDPKNKSLVKNSYVNTPGSYFSPQSLCI